ncbi:MULTISPECIES: hypothetical protein [unclassified Methylobacterium]|jgi:hypothetical protein|uniref:hypothetical protein n=1 Tax=unclassified Methylobacterium TaxID=2615210 RepID=UPI000CACF559|nr:MULTISPECIES: hypothetical protein [unclassified Methylobacterium]PIU06643.1 MAG: hypothetical protein COT56_08400 [Methylobacterium sp. CG09_land_8_20_14_0_10_71_15]PIU12097.1 MAG: hypothetical protein COT28_16845 [Methylobacterium sp. CG08_land_8_20_14_0_20_71_15]GBU19677.1 hypothetical protein AwMethylo_38920 [Methylobacterium sp.]
MRPRIALCLLAAFALGTSVCNRNRLPKRRQQASLSPSPIRRAPTPEEAARLAGGRVAAEALVAIEWKLAPEDAARIAMAWPANTPLISARTQ